MPYATANGVRLYYEERGSGTPILGLHGAGSSALFWEEAAEKLSELGRVIIYDRRGCTRSERPEPYEITSVREHADDARALLRELDAEPAILIGRSYGGTVALDLALRHPESVLALALLEAGPMGLSPEYDAWFTSLRDQLEELAAQDRIDAVGEAVLREVLGAWEELPAAYREVFTANSPALLAEIRGEERLTDNARTRRAACSDSRRVGGGLTGAAPARNCRTGTLTAAGTLGSRSRRSRHRSRRPGRTRIRGRGAGDLSRYSSDG